MSGGGLSNITSSINASAQNMPQSGTKFNQPNTGWNQQQFTTDPTKMSPTQHWWTNTEMGKSQGGQEGLNTTLRNQIQAAMGNYGNMVDYANKTGISQADIQNAIGGNTDMYTYMNRPNYQQFGTNGQFNQPIYRSNYQNNNTGNAMGVSQYGMDPNVYMPRANNPFNPYTNSYQSSFSYYQPSAQTAAQPTSTATGNTLTPEIARSLMQRSMVGGVNTSEFDRYGGYEAVQAMYDAGGGSYAKPTATAQQQMSTQQVPYNYSQRATVPTYGTANQAIVGRSSSVRGTPNVLSARKAEGGIASLMDDVE